MPDETPGLPGPPPIVQADPTFFSFRPQHRNTAAPQHSITSHDTTPARLCTAALPVETHNPTCIASSLTPSRPILRIHAAGHCRASSEPSTSTVPAPMSPINQAPLNCLCTRIANQPVVHSLESP
ncbi:hypothetical protein CHU98_g7208 [Xylaria longipes]|nr:hypothetical protein CHU98_g7208 [Xylaria longipes]